jgi:CheY-like chemotaxis protein
LRQKREIVLIVDDLEENLLLLKHILQGDYEILIASSGDEALKFANNIPNPDLILLDIMMPDMNGYMVMRKLKNNEVTRDIPVIFLTAMGEIKDETKGLMMGAVDYIVKPVKAPIVKARVRTHIQLSRAQNHIQNLYDTTLTGLIELLTDILETVSPAAFNKAGRVRLHIRKILDALGLKGYWEFDLASMLSQIGCVTLDTRVLEDIYSGIKVPGSEYQLFKEHPVIGKRLLQNIPYLEDISEIIGGQNQSLKQIFSKIGGPAIRIEASELDKTLLGSLLLKLAIKIEEYTRISNSIDEAFKLVASDVRPLNTELAGVLDNISTTEQEIKALQVHQLAPGMVLEKDLYTQNGTLLLSATTPISQTILERIKAFDRATGLVTPVIISSTK